MQKQDRLISLDVFRGITIAGMVLVNNPGSWEHIYAPLEHAEWNGCTPTDLVFPFFLFIVGVAITLSLTKRKDSGDNQTKLILNIFRRSAILFLLGLLKKKTRNLNVFFFNLFQFRLIRSIKFLTLSLDLKKKNKHLTSKLYKVDPV